MVGFVFLYQKRAENGTRTRDPNLGKVVLYQLSYFRNVHLAKVGTLFILGKVVLYQLSYFRLKVKQLLVKRRRLELPRRN